MAYHKTLVTSSSLFDSELGHHLNILMKLTELLTEEVVTVNHVVYDNVNGIGATGYNANIDYRGVKVLMKPSIFLHLAMHISEDQFTSAKGLEALIKEGKPIAPPYLELDLKDGENGQPTGIGAKVGGHEGRNRAYAIKKLYGDEPMLTHLFFLGLRARHITPEILFQLNKQLVNQNNQKVQGPFFEIL